MHEDRSALTVRTSSELPTEKELVLAFQSGQGDAYARIYQRYLPVVGSICRRMLKDLDDAEEATQETMLRVLQGLGQFNGRYLLQAWVARIATNVCLDVLRARARHPFMVELAAEEAGDPLASVHAAKAADPCDELERRVDCEQVRGILAGLPENHRDALVMRSLNGLSHEEMAERMSMTAPQVKALIHRAKGSFRKAWGSRGGAGLFFPAFLWKIPLPRFVRKFLGLGVDSTSGSAGAAMATPAVSVAGSVTSERVVAAVTAVIVGSAGVGVLAAAKLHRPAPPKPPAAVSQVTPHVVHIVTVHRAKARRRHNVKRATEAPAIPVPVSTWSPAPEPSPFPSADPSPSPSPSPSETPTLAPEPLAFTLAFQSDRPADYRCGCGDSRQQDSNAQGDDNGITYFWQSVKDAAALEAGGGAAWGLQYQQASRTGDDYSLDFTLRTNAGPYDYTAQGSLASSHPTDWGGWTLVYAGQYSFSSGPSEDTGTVPHNGTFTARVEVSWRTSRVVSATFSLVENSP